MVQGKEKSRSKRRVYVKTPGGKLKKHYRIRKPSQLTCAECGKKLLGIPRLIPSKFRSLPKTKKRASRPYSNLCSKCMRKKLLSKI
ncbi:50S ribosomal protein L34e [Candidatus Woesearchaeota archaeon]|jgi:large subunit ribosomal protein L34e|nr:50S ribosomal protein L34e [Candidatus Woesearchaeota archaeon]MBT4321714.1 50S ribosomal protein L34e [Candidatus Woesearchaeota archaeon]MBT4631194.1 50S ribosomal protein L34e [Candidatus Woesearchaeota archaeon]